MPLIDYPHLEELDGKTRGILDHAKNEQGQVASFPHMLSNNPAVLEACLGQFAEVIYGGSVGLDLKQLAFVVVSQENRCGYCAASHGAQLVNVVGLPATYLEAIAEGDYTEFTHRQRAVAEFAQQAAIDPKRVSADHVEALRTAGFDDADVIEIVAVVAQAAFANTVVDVLNILPADESPELEQYYPKRDTA